MRYVQIGILGLLGVIAVLLGGIYSEQRSQRLADAPVAAESAPEPLFETAVEEPAVALGTPAEQVPEPLAVQPHANPRPPVQQRPAPRYERFEPTQPATVDRRDDPTLAASAPPLAVSAPDVSAEAASVASAAAEVDRLPRSATIPEGTLLQIRLQQSIASNRSREGETFAAILEEPLIVDGMVIAEDGARVDGEIAYLRRSGRLEGRALIELELTRLYTSDGQEVEIYTRRESREADSSVKKDARNVAIGAGIGAIIGAIAGGGKGAAIGAGAGAGAGAGGAAATRGKPARYEVEEQLTFELAAPVTLIERI